jgi:DNA replication protein DnaC
MNTYALAKEIIDKQRSQQLAEFNRRYDEIHKRIPEIAELNRSLASTVTALWNIPQENFSAELERIKQKNLSDQETVKFLLEKHGYLANYLDVVYKCPQCADTGFFGENRCACLETLAASLAVKQLNDEACVTLSDFSEIDTQYYRDTPEFPSCRAEMTKILEFCKQYAENFEHAPHGGILMTGRTGRGKTLFSLAIAKRVTERGFTALYDSAASLFQRLNDEQFGKAKNHFGTRNLAVNANLLILDDLGSEFDTAFTHSALYDIISTRLARKKQTIFTTNLVPATLKTKYDERVFSRLMTFWTLNFTGQDIRFQKMQGNRQ